jgi:hypothetical protein
MVFLEKDCNGQNVGWGSGSDKGCVLTLVTIEDFRAGKDIFDSKPQE